MSDHSVYGFRRPIK